MYMLRHYSNRKRLQAKIVKRLLPEASAGGGCLFLFEPQVFSFQNFKTKNSESSEIMLSGLIVA